MQVLNCIIAVVVVDMMNDFHRMKLTAKELLHNESMLKHLSVPDGHHPR